jgi:hypothetical protein
MNHFDSRQYIAAHYYTTSFGLNGAYYNISSLINVRTIHS